MKEGNNLMKRCVCLFLVVFLLSGLVLLASCTCSAKEEAKLPFGVVLDGRGNLSTKAIDVQYTDIWKNKNNVIVDRAEWAEQGSESVLYEQINYVVRVQNIGATGPVIFTANIYDYAESVVLGKDQQTISFSLAKLAEERITFSFFIKEGSTSTFKVQAVNARDFIIPE
ncbi:hypothetical protein ACFLTP_06755 [Chloroflexota bacterium]